MDSVRFDGIARELRSVDTRRGAVKTLAAAILGLGVVRIGMADAGARKKSKKNKKKNDFNTKSLGQFCAKSAQCQGDLICQIANSQNGFPERANQKVCCVPADVQAHCDSGADCCGVDVICNGGYCQSA